METCKLGHKYVSWDGYIDVIAEADYIWVTIP